MLGPDHPNIAVVLNNLIAFYREQGRNAEARRAGETREWPERLSFWPFPPR